MAAPLPIASPSWVLPGDVLANARFLAGRVEEVGLCLFEAEACLAYPASMWTELASLPLAYHLHFPLDLQWGALATQVCLSLANRGRPLSPRAYVLHPPPARTQLCSFVHAWEAAGFEKNLLLLENTPGCSLEQTASLAYGIGLGLCVDLGHLLLAGEGLTPDILAKCGMLHLSCPEVTPRGHRHLGLERLDAAGRESCLALLQGAPQARRMVEVFSWDEVAASAQWLAAHDPHWQQGR